MKTACVCSDGYANVLILFYKVVVYLFCPHILPISHVVTLHSHFEFLKLSYVVPRWLAHAPLDL